MVPSFQQGKYGTYAEEAIIPAHSLEPRPPDLSAIEASAVWMQYMTAIGIVEIGKLGPGDFIIIPAASSSVGIAAIQIANAVGAVPIAATRTSAKVEALKVLGAAHVIATEEQDLVAETLRITDGKGARIVFDPVGGPYVETLARATAEEGIIFIYGGLSGQPTPYPHWTAAMKGLSLRGWVASAIWNKPDRFARSKEFLLSGLASGKLKPIIAKTFPLADIVEAHRYLEGNQQIGKVVVTV